MKDSHCETGGKNREEGKEFGVGGRETQCQLNCIKKQSKKKKEKGTDKPERI